LNTPAKKTQQVAKTSGTSTAKQAPPKLAAKEVSGKARVSDMDDVTRNQMVAQKAPPKPDASKRPAAQVRRQESQLASASIDPQRPAASRSGVSKSDADAVATKTRKPVAIKFSTTRAPSEIAGRDLPNNDSVRQTAGTGQSALIAKRNQAELTRPAVQPPEPAAVRQPDPQRHVGNVDTAVASSHERRRADRLMERAHERFSSGYPEEAMRLASVAVELEKSHQARYRRGEERPSDYITWLQSMAATRSANPPLIRPQAGPRRQATSASETGSAIAAAGAETSDQRRTGDVIRANAGSNVPPAAGLVSDTATATRSNTGVDLAGPEAPRFVDSPNSRAGANAGQVEVPVPPKPRSADASLAMANAGGPSLDASALPELPSPVADNDRRPKSARSSSTDATARDNAAETSATAFVATEDPPAETDAFAESETPSLAPARTTQLTIASLVGLITGIAGMFGLSWWRRQEQRHYAAGK
jgi:hypothetical protein